MFDMPMTRHPGGDRSVWCLRKLLPPGHSCDRFWGSGGILHIPHPLSQYVTVMIIAVPCEETWELEFLQNRCCPYCGSKDPAESAVSAVSKTKTPIIVGFLETAEIEGGKKRRNLITCTKARISRGPFAREM